MVNANFLSEIKMFLLIISLIFCIKNNFAEDKPKINIENIIPKEIEKFKLFLLVGQSNMAGRGEIDKSQNTIHPRVWMLNKENQWVPAKEPVHFDKPVAGFGLSITFAKILAEKNPDISIGLIPCAMGGSSIDEWKENRPLFKNAIERTLIACQKGKLEGILWHQGETDSEKGKGLTKVYEDKLLSLISNFRTSLNRIDLPFISGEIGRWHDNEEAIQINKIFHSIKSKVVNYECVSSEGLVNKAKDTAHFNSESYIELGKRYALAYLSIIDNCK